MSPDESPWEHYALGKTSRRGFLKGVTALAAMVPTVARARGNQATLTNGLRLAYVGTYSSPQGPEGSKGNGQGIYLFQMIPTPLGLRSIPPKPICTQRMRPQLFRVPAPVR